MGLAVLLVAGGGRKNTISIHWEHFQYYLMQDDNSALLHHVTSMLQKYILLGWIFQYVKLLEWILQYFSLYNTTLTAD